MTRSKCANGHDICLQGTSPGLAECWGIAFDDSAHPESIRAVGRDPHILDYLHERLAAELVGAGVDLSTVTWSGRGLESIDA